MIDELRKKTDNKILLVYLAILVSSGLLYVVTCAPAIVWQDSALFSWRIWNNDVQGDIGIALAHPLYILIGIVLKYIPLGSFAYRLNLFSAICGAVAVANVFLLLRLWFDSNRPGIIAAITLAVSWTFWQHTAIAEVYTFYAAQMLTELIILLLFLRSKKMAYLYMLAFLNGLSLANHNWALFCSACYGVLFVIMLWRRQIKIWHVFVIPFVFMAGALPYVYLMVQEFRLTGNFGATISSALFGTLWQSDVTNVSVSMKLVAENIAFIVLNFATPNILLMFVGIWVLLRKTPERCFANIVLILSAMYLIFAFRYAVVDRYAFFLPFYCYGAMFIGIGADALLKVKQNCKILLCLLLAFCLMPTAVYAFTPELGRKFYPSLGKRRQLPYKEPYGYFLQPWKTGYRGAEKFAKESLDVVEEGSVFWADSTVVHLILYVQQAENCRPDVRVTSRFYQGPNAPVLDEGSVGNILNDSAVYVVSPMRDYCPEYILTNYDFEKTDLIYRVVKRD